MITVEHILQAAKYAVDHPDKYDQATWCGTACCVAGHARNIAGLPQRECGLTDLEFKPCNFREEMLTHMMYWPNASTAELMLLVADDGTITIPEGGVGDFGEGTKIGYGANIGYDVIIGAGCQLGDGMRIGRRTVVDSGVKIGCGSIIHEFSVIEPNVSIGANVWIDSHAIIGCAAVIGHHTGIGSFCSVGRGAEIGRYVNVHPNSRVEPGAKIADRKEIR